LAAMKDQPHPEVSIVIPVYNEKENIPLLHVEIQEECRKLNRSYEVIFINDGSTDGSQSALEAIQKTDISIKIITLRKNFGQTAAMSAGFDFARGDVIITMDADLQNDPADIGLLLEKLEDGFDIVSGWRAKRKDKFFTRRLPSTMANWLISFITRVKLHDYGCTLKAFRKDVVKNINLYGEMHRFIPAIASHMGVEIAEVKVNHRPRRFGKSKYSIWRFVKVILDLLTVKFLLSYSTRPLQIFGIFGISSGALGGGLGLYLSYRKLILNEAIANRPLLLLAILLLVVGFQFITLGLLAEIMVRSYHESLEKRTYYIRRIIQDEEDESTD
jgi:glycosyltransferase involved in cell wall biosynthesis